MLETTTSPPELVAPRTVAPPPAAQSRFIADVEAPVARRVDYVQEERFHDEWGHAIDPNQVPVVESFEACTAPENRFIRAWLGDVRGLRVLDLGCGAGEAAVYFARAGAVVTAVDLSPGMLEATRRLARRYEVRLRCVRQNVDLLDIPPQSYDIVYAGNLLHHVNLERCLATVARLLTPTGRFVSWDPLRHNPIINIYRRMARAVRTADESPLDIRDLRHFRQHFGEVSYRCYWLTSLWIFMRFFLIERVHPSKERYWKKIILEAERLRRTYTRLERVDRLLTACFPFLRRMCWNLVVCAARPRGLQSATAPQE